MYAVYDKLYNITYILAIYIYYFVLVIIHLLAIYIDNVDYI